MATGGALDGASVSVDARYLKRRGIGISETLVQILRDLLDSGVRLDLLTDDDDHATALSAEWPDASVHAFGSPSGLRWEQIDLPRWLHRARPDVHLAPSNWGLSAWPSRPTRKVLLVHDLVPLRLPRTYLTSRPAWAVKYLISLGLSLLAADLVVTVSAATAADVRRVRRRRPVETLYLLLPDPALPPAVAAGRRYVLYNGGFDPRKNVAGLLRAFALVAGEVPADLDLVILGAAPEEVAADVRSLGLEQRVHLVGYVSANRKERYLREASAMAYPSRLEGFGLPVVEALAAGVPVVSGTGGSLREVGGDAVTFVDVENPRSIADGLVAVLGATPGSTREAGLAQLERLAARHGGRLSAVLAAYLGRWR